MITFTPDDRFDIVFIDYSDGIDEPAWVSRYPIIGFRFDQEHDDFEDDEVGLTPLFLVHGIPRVPDYEATKCSAWGVIRRNQTIAEGLPHIYDHAAHAARASTKLSGNER